MAIAIKTSKLTKYYSNGKILGVRDLDMEIKAGEIFGFIGPNGAGKSTTIRLLLDLIRPTSGKATLFDLDSTQDTVSIKKQLGYLPGEIFLPENLTGLECVSYFKAFKGKIEASYINRLISKLDLNLNKKVGTYSKGNKQKLAIVLAMMHKPKLLLLDEPTSGLDPLNQQAFYDLILETKKWEATVFFSTHILTEAERVCDRVGIIKGGKLLKIEDIDDFRSKNIREMNIETSETVPLSVFESGGAKKITRTTWGYHVTTAGKNGDLIRKLAKYAIDDIKISEPSLEDIFMHYYKND